MKTLQEAIDQFRDGGGANITLRKHFATAGITEWAHFSDRETLYKLHDTVTGAVSQSTAKTIFQNLKAFIRRNRDYVEMPEGWTDIFKAKAERPMRTYLTPEEIRKFEGVATHTPKEEIVRVESLLEAYTGARISDIMLLTAENVVDGKLTYVSKKTKIQSTVPVSKKIIRWIMYAQTHRRDEPSTVSRCEIIRKLCKRAGIDSPVTVFQAGKTKKGAKWEFITSHSFRISFVTNLQQSGMNLLDISRLSGHRNVAMTERYCARAEPKLTWLAQEFLGLNED